MVYNVHEVVVVYLNWLLVGAVLPRIPASAHLYSGNKLVMYKDSSQRFLYHLII